MQERLRGDLGGFVVRRGRALVNEQEVHVGGVVELPAAPLAQRDRREMLGARGLGHRRRPACVGDIGDLVHDLIERGAGEVARGDPQHRAPPEPPQTRRGTEAFDVPRDLEVEVRSGAGCHGREQSRLLRVSHEEVGGGLREPEHLDRDRRDDRTLEDLARLGPLADPLPCDARQRGIGGVGQRAIEVHADGASGPSGPSSASGGGTTGPAPSARAAASPTLVERTFRFMRIDRRSSCSRQSFSISSSARSARSLVPVVVTVGLVDLAPQRRKPGALGHDLGVQLLVVGQEILLAVVRGLFLLAQTGAKRARGAIVLGRRERLHERVARGVELRAKPFDRGRGWRMHARPHDRGGEVATAAEGDRERRRILRRGEPHGRATVGRGDRARGRRGADVRGGLGDRGDPLEHRPSRRRTDRGQPGASRRLGSTFVERHVVAGRQDGGGAEALDHLRHVRRRREPGQREGRVRHHADRRGAQGGQPIAGVVPRDPDPDAACQTLASEIGADRRGLPHRQHGEPRDRHVGLERTEALHQQSLRRVAAGIQRHRAGDHHGVERGGEFLLPDGSERPERLIGPADGLGEPGRSGASRRGVGAQLQLRDPARELGPQDRCRDGVVALERPEQPHAHHDAGSLRESSHRRNRGPRSRG